MLVSAPPPVYVSTNSTTTPAVDQPDLSHLTLDSSVLSVSATPAATNALTQIPTSMVPMGTTTMQASGSEFIFSESLGPATMTRTASQISVNSSMGQGTATVDPSNPTLLDLSAQGTTYKGTVTATNGGYEWKSTTGQTIQASGTAQSGLTLNLGGFPSNNATITLTP